MAQEELIVPQVDGSLYRWRFGAGATETVFEVDGARGARVSRFSLGGEDILTGPEVNALNFGSTFWISPQSQWGWPPPVEHDGEPYAAHQTGATGAVGVFTGRFDAKLGVAVTKTFAVDGARGAVTIAYTMRNHGAVPLAIAPWEISRHPTGGLTFFPLGDGVGPASTLAVKTEAGVVWFAYDAGAVTDHQKLFAHGREGWICHVDPGRGLQLVKTFPEVAAVDQAPGEAALELYADPEHTYIEVEQQGPCRPLPPGESVTWPVRWLLRPAPPAAEVRAGNPALLAGARALARLGG